VGAQIKNPVWGFLFVRGSEVKQNFRRKEKIEVERRRMRPTGLFDADPGRNEGGAFWRRQSEVMTPFGWCEWQVKKKEPSKLPLLFFYLLNFVL